MSDPFIYVQWLTAKSNLMESLRDADSWDDRCKRVDEWFKSHIFEIGSEYRTTNDYLKTMAGDAKSIITRESIRGICDHLLQKGLYMQTRNPVAFDETGFCTTILVCGTPKIVGPSTRKLP